MVQGDVYMFILFRIEREKRVTPLQVASMAKRKTG
jgi:hypothetical protein